MRSFLASIGLALALLASAHGEARADDPPSSPTNSTPSPYRFHTSLDLPLIGLGLATSMAFLIEPQVPACLPSCEPPSSMNSIDRRVLGNYSTDAHMAANLIVTTLLLAPHAANVLFFGGRKDNAWLEDIAISLEAVLVTQGLTQLTKAAVGRYAPIVYDENVPLDERTSKDALGSFWSGHTATAFSAATSFAVSYWLRNPRDPWRWVMLAALESAALSVGFLKIRAGYHYPSDIAAGAMAGASVGVLIPMLHSRF